MRPGVRFSLPFVSGLLPFVSGLLFSSVFAGNAASTEPARIADNAAGAEMCDNAARIASRRHGVPLDVMNAISRTETGRFVANKLSPWPWTVNLRGKGYWFTSRRAAHDFVRRHMKQGARSFDVGCFQINYKWHGAAFRSVSDMFDPINNADYAATYLNRLNRELGDWSLAAGAYHSRTPEKAKGYTKRFEQIRTTMTSPDSPVRRPGGPAVETAFKLPNNSGKQSFASFTISAKTRSPGSLVPASEAPSGRGLSLIAMNKKVGFRVLVDQ